MVQTIERSQVGMGEAAVEAEIQTGVGLPKDLKVVLGFCALGRDSAEVADILSIDQETVKEKEAELQVFFGAPNMAAAVHRAIKARELRVEPEQGRRHINKSQSMVLGFIASGLDNREIGEKFGGKNPNTVRRNVTKPLIKNLGARNRTHAVLLGHKFGYLS